MWLIIKRTPFYMLQNTPISLNLATLLCLFFSLFLNVYQAFFSIKTRANINTNLINNTLQ